MAGTYQPIELVLTTAGTAYQLISTATPVRRGVRICLNPTAAATDYAFVAPNASIAITTGWPLFPGGPQIIPACDVQDASELYLIGSVNGLKIKAWVF